MKKYDHKKIEKKWQQYWDEHQTFRTPEAPKNKRYILDMFPYPSGEGLHVGHPEGYTATDILARYFRMNGYDVLHPMGWDAFGLPAENYAIKQGIVPAITTQKNINRFREQIKSLGLSYDWDREIDTSSPEYYKWTQWLFLLFYKNGLAYKKEAYVNWCPKDNTVLANEQVVNGVCQRCGTTVIQKLLNQWFFKITDYAERLLRGLEHIDWPESIKAMQKNWIGKSVGAEIDFVIPSINHTEMVAKVFTTRPDTLFGATYLVLAPEHPLLEELQMEIQNWAEVADYIGTAKKKMELERTMDKEKTGVELRGVYAINPATAEPIPVWIADYVLASYGTGAIMAVPAHDERDFAFAKKYQLPITPVVVPTTHESPAANDLPFTNAGVLVNSGKFSGLATYDAIMHMSVEFGQASTRYKLRDWLLSRQRYWGAPIPIVYCADHGMQAVPEDQLPILLPTDVDFKPTGESPLANSVEFHRATCPVCGKTARRDSDTMDTFVDSSWYYFRFADPHNDQQFANTSNMKEWLPVDTYVGGAEHAVLHLLYARFFTKALFDLGYVNFEEPFLQLRNQGLILGPDGEKMSKSKGNVINPDDIVEEFGADSLRMYEMFMGPLEDTKPWNTNGLVGLRRFLDRVWSWVNICQVNSEKLEVESSGKTDKELHKLIKKVTEDIENYKFNTAISSFMEFYNAVKDEPISKPSLVTFVTLLYPFAPHISEELYELLGYTPSLQQAPWPPYDATKIQESTVQIIVQINGKLRDKVIVPVGASKAVVTAAANELEKVATVFKGVSPKKIIFVPDKLINFVL